MALRVHSVFFRLSLAALAAVCISACRSEPAPGGPSPGVAPVSPAAAASLGAGPVAPAAAVSPEAERKTFGAPLDAGAERVALADLLREPGRFADKTIRTEGKVTAVCKGQGCWLEIGDDASAAHVKLAGHRFFVPRTSAGKRAEVQARVLPMADDGHCEKEAVEQTGKVAKVELEATGVELF